MTISKGDKLPEATFREITADGPHEIKTSDFFSGRKVVLFGVPGAFTPTCHRTHLPGFVDKLDELKAKGVDAVACVAVNDMFVLDAWAKETGAHGKITFLSDGNGEFTKAAGLEMDGSGVGLGLRSKRFVMIVDDGEVQMVAVEPVPSQADETSADVALNAL